MAVNEHGDFLGSYWNDLNIPAGTPRNSKTDESARSKAERCRRMMNFLERMKDSNCIEQDLHISLVSSTQDQYAKLVDSIETDKGLNNYAESIMDILSGTKNGSKSWFSSLSLDGDSAHKSVINGILERAKDDCTSQQKTLKYKPRNLKCNPKDQSKGDLQQTKIEQSSTLRRQTTATDAIPKLNFCTLEPNKEICLKNQESTATMPQPVFAKRKYYDDMVESNKQARVGPSTVHSKSNNEIRKTEGQRLFKLPENAAISTGYQRRSKGTGVICNKDQSNGNGIEDEYESEDHQLPSANLFVTARDQYAIDQRKKNRLGSSNDSRSIMQSDYGQTKKSLGTRRGTSSRFVPPVMNREVNGKGTNSRASYNAASAVTHGNNECQDERLKNIEPRMIEMIENEIMDHGSPVSWDDIAGLEFAKKTIQEIVIWPMLRPDIFTGLRGPPKGLLLFGPPGTGKTLIGKCIASQSHATFFSISASSLTSKWIGEGEKMVRALFAVARCQESAVIFIDEIDSLLSQRTDGEHEATRRIKTEFLVQLDGATTRNEDRILVVGATNRPQELDEAARRRLVKRLYIPLPEDDARRQIVQNLVKEQNCSLSCEDYAKIMESTLGYSGADVANLCREAALGPIRSIRVEDIRYITSDEVRPILFQDFESALKNIRPSVSQKDLESYTSWNRLYGSGGL